MKSKVSCLKYEGGHFSRRAVFLVQPGSGAREMSAVIIEFWSPMPTLRGYAERCRRLALLARSPAVREHLLAIARQMEGDAAELGRRDAARTDREAG